MRTTTAASPSTPRNLRSLTLKLSLAGLAAGIPLLIAGPALAATSSSDHSGNDNGMLSCPDGSTLYKQDGSESHTFGGVRFTVSDHERALSFSSASDGTVVALVSIKGGNAYRVYTFDPAATSGSRMYAPVNHGGNVPEISHWSACVGTAQPTPVTTVPVPETTAPVPETTVPVPETTVPVPETTVPVPETTVPVPETTVPVPETTIPVPETTIPVPETTIPVPETTIPVPETTIPVPETTIPVPETTIPVPETTIPVPETTIPVPETTLEPPVTEAPATTAAPTPDLTVAGPDLTPLAADPTTAPAVTIDLPYELPVTGSSHTMAWVLTAAGLVAAGGGLLLLTRRSSER